MRLRAVQWAGVAAAGALVALAGCGGSSGEGSGGSKKSDGSVTLTWQMWAAGADEEKQLKHLASLVTQEHPDIELELKTAPFKDYFTKLQTQAAGGDQPCLVSMQSLRLSGFTDLMEPLDSLLKDGAGTDGFEPAALEALQWQGKQYALPMDLASMLMYYNKDAFAKAGLDEPKTGWTVADFEKAAKSLTKNGKTGFGLSFSDLPMLTMALTYNDARPVTTDGKAQLDDPAMVKAMTWYSGLATKDKAASVPASSSDGGWAETQFVNGNAMMAVDGTWNLGSTSTQAKFKVGVAPIPAGPDGSKTYVANSGFGVSKSCAYKKEAVEALSVLTGPEAQNYLAGQGRVFPARTAAQPAYEKFLTQQTGGQTETVKAGMSAVRDGLAGGEPFVGTQNWDEVNTLFSQYLLEAYTGSTSAESALTAIQKKAGR
ncbi:ABC transporter substrate-binding protein [Streptomyces xanthii]|uniref:Sugar ABC transporter substrate-binding protein n=1 Tax=Streptomyces xanthii TaxID=2768069 RepID=A0A7H1B0H6_9ACTN|nr:sugar ABC transporter substrate-binding protein [Streptomyces xanthii]QNS02231.1 sugar ABC transporter substrate-binding protein [Streptomyces xanthii]